MPPRILIVGASARAAAQSAHRAGIQVTAIDLFADQDLAEIAEVIRCPPTDYPHAIPHLAHRLEPSPFCFVGGLENHPEILAQLQASRPLVGTPPAAIRRCRDPFQVMCLAERHGFPVPDTRRQPPDSVDETGWLVKPFASAGGSVTDQRSSHPRSSGRLPRTIISVDCEASSVLVASSPKRALVSYSG